ncbi:MFS general substrate transporter [Apiospora arundinis]
MRPDDHQHFIPAYSHGDKELFHEVPQFTKAEFGISAQSPAKQSGSRRPSRRNSINEKKKAGSGDEIEAARRILAAAEASARREPHTRRDSGSAAAAPPSSQRASSPPATIRSATPPPIGRPRRYFYDETEPDQQQKDPNMRTPDKIPPRLSSRRTSSPRRRRSVTSMSTARSRVEPVLDDYQLDDDEDEEEDEPRRPPPIPPNYGSMGHKRGGSHSTSKKARSTKERDADSFRDFDGPSVYVRNHESTTLTVRGAARLRRTYSDDELSVQRGGGGGGGGGSYAPSSKQSVVSHGSRRMPEFFSEEAFQTVLYNPITARELQKFSEQRLCGENVEFLAKVGQYQDSLGALSAQLATIHKSFISDQSSSQITAPRELLLAAHREIKTTVSGTFVNMESLFTDLQKRVEHTVFTDIYPRFVREKVSLSAIQALASDRHKYQGLGDCFVLSDPNKADNPIVFASDGFVKVTGYSRREVVPRNCRFLQGPQTDRETVRNMRMSLDARKETVELILNYKKNGDPFWNLLFMAPLFDETGTLAFFIGGQVNCSTTIHSNTDVMKVLSGAAVKETEAVPKRAPQIHRQSSMPSARKALLKAFGVRVDEARTLADLGMEDEVLGRMEGQELGAQMKEFRTAYSKYLVVRADTFVIHFYSEGVSEMLHPGNTAGLVTGQEVFRFFKANMVSKESDYRSRVRLAVRNGQPLSVEIRLQTRRSALYRGDERFVTHWTPLKDESSATEWVVVTLAPTMG